MNASDNEKFEFFTDNDGDPQRFIFDTINNKPIKLGDGTFGVVYRVKGGNGERYALKLLYNKKTLPELRPVEISRTFISDYRHRFDLPDDCVVVKELERLEGEVMELGPFFAKLGSLNIPTDQSLFLNERICERHDSIALQRFEFEMKSSERIMRLLGESGFEKFAGIIKIVGSIRAFKKSNAYKYLRTEFEASQIEVSNYGLVMPCYDWTLKELLESDIDKDGRRTTCFGSNCVDVDENEGVSEPVQEQHHENDMYVLTGYGMLQRMTYKERISTILPFLLNIAQGLKLLHDVKMFHLDVKPANIFVKQEGDEVRSVIGDLGYLNAQSTVHSCGYSTSDVLPLGTRHYRSPEQKDHFDICDVEIVRQGDGDHKWKLIVVDPKFQDTIIEKGDYLVFSKDYRQIKYEIEEIVKDSKDSKDSKGSEESEDTHILLNINNDSAEAYVAEDKRTQVILYKKQAVRTDLFGFGAIVYDLLTCGRSPEYFYDSIRKYDNSGYDVSDIWGPYEQVLNNQSTPQQFVQIFEPFKHQQQYEFAPPEIVELILKCMLFNARNSYSSMSEVYSKVVDIEGMYHIKRLNNPLVDRRFDKIETIENRKFDLHDEIKRLQDRTIDDQQLYLIYRLVNGIRYFGQLVELVKDNIVGKNRFFADMMPKNIAIEKKELRLIYSVYEAEDAYKEDLKEDRVYSKIARDIMNPFVPNYLSSLRRRIQLKQESTGGGGGDNAFRYSFYDSSLFGNCVSEGDWIVSDRELFPVLKANQTILFLENGASIDDEAMALFYRKIDSYEYCLQMLGIYLFQFFFAGIGGNSTNKSPVVSLAQILLHITKDLKPIKIVEPVLKKGIWQNELNAIYNYIVLMYLKLTFCEHDHSYYKEALERKEVQERKEAQEKNIYRVKKHAYELKTLIAELLGFVPEELDDSIDCNKLESRLNRTLRRKIGSDYSERIGFEEMFLRYVRVSTLDIYKNI